MKKLCYCTCLLVAVLLAFPAYAQLDHCATQYVSEQSLKDPAVRARRDAVIHAAKNWIDSHPQQGSQAVLSIPVVFHIMHEGGAENISKAQVLDQVRIMNEDFRRLNADTVNTPAPFAAVAADCEIEFHLAQRDPDGNCTDGIVRVHTSLTVNATDDVKFLSTWDNDRYLNVWVVKSIYNFTGGLGTILGYAYYPGTAPAGCDGYIVRADYTGSIEYAATHHGRTATHEIGHYLDLVHIWGDSNCGDDQVNDTPDALGPNYGCASFPHNSPGCNMSPNGEMYVNYMDYSDDDCMNMFSMGQKQRMMAAINAHRSLLVDPANHVFTGIFNAPSACTLVPDFRVNKRVVCEGDSVKFIDQSWNGDATARQWNISGGVMSSTSDSIVWVTFPAAGIYDAGITISNALGFFSKNESGYIVVKPAAVQHTGVYSENFDSNFSFPTSGMDQYGSAVPYALSSVAAASAPNAIRLPAASGSDDTLSVLVLPSFDLSSISTLKLSFNYACALTNANALPQLRVEVSNNCGNYWQLRAARRGSVLTGTVAPGNFVPSASDWQHMEVNVNAISNISEGLIRITVYNNGLSNFYLDDINLSNTVGLSSPENALARPEVFPNPAGKTLDIRFQQVKSSRVRMELIDLSGRVAWSHDAGIVAVGEFNYQLQNEDAFSGMYLLRITTGNGTLQTPVVFQ